MAHPREMITKAKKFLVNAEGGMTGSPALRDKVDQWLKLGSLAVDIYYAEDHPEDMVSSRRVFLLTSVLIALRNDTNLPEDTRQTIQDALDEYSQLVEEEE